MRSLAPHGVSCVLLSAPYARFEVHHAGRLDLVAVNNAIDIVRCIHQPMYAQCSRH